MPEICIGLKQSRTISSNESEDILCDRVLIEAICAPVQGLVNGKLQKSTQALSMGKQCAFEDSAQLVPDRPCCSLQLLATKMFQRM